MSEKAPCACGEAPKLIFACSGAADAGALADQAARKMTRDGVGKMYCLAGLGGHLPGIISTTQKACKILAIDGCPLNCVHHTLEQAGFKDFLHLQLADLGLIKGQSPLTDENIRRVTTPATELLAKGTTP
ncbi:MAG TPA: zinc-binding protein [Verrucomicrobia bacterium]|nr:MAG: zinc-binding protein [Lentisphaerae bacterium GWF2_57_35]HBA82515.1 zinc-binding protein [Verrucomicrobiota bacterium]